MWSMIRLICYMKLEDCHPIIANEGAASCIDCERLGVCRLRLKLVLQVWDHFTKGMTAQDLES